MLEEVKKAAKLSGEEIVYRSLLDRNNWIISFKKAKQVYGFEVIRSSLENAERNAKINNISNTSFYKANLDTFFKSGQLPKKIPKPDIVIVDPPRAGMHPDMVQYLPKLNAKKSFTYLVILLRRQEMQKYYVKKVIN